MREKVLIIGGSHRDIPLIKAYKKLGFFVYTYAKADAYIGHRYADKAVFENFRDLDKLRAYIEQEKIDYVVPGSGEIPMLLAAKIGKYRFDSFETTKKIHNKKNFKALCQKFGIDTPRSQILTSAKELVLDLPVIIKPFDLSGGKGVNAVFGMDDLDAAIKSTQQASNSKEVLVEEFVQSDLFAYSTIIKDQKIIFGFLAQEIEKNYFVTTTFGTTLQPTIMQKLQENIEKLASSQNLSDGLLHVQFMLKNATPLLLEVTRRMPGDLFPTLIERSTGVAFSEAVALGYLGKTQTFDALLKVKKDEKLARHCIVADKNARLESIKFDPALNILQKVSIYEQGSFIPKGAIIAIVIVHAQEYKNLEKYIKVVYANDTD